MTVIKLAADYPPWEAGRADSTNTVSDNLATNSIIRAAGKAWRNMGDWITDHRFGLALVAIVIGAVISFPMVTFAPTWLSTTYVIVLALSLITTVVRFFGSI